jgi:hypothetical protein
MSDGGGTSRAYEQMSSMRSVGSAGSHGSGERGFQGMSHHRPYPMAPGESHLMNGETQFPPSLYHAASDVAKSDAATVCSGSVVEDIEEESVISQEGVGSLSATSHPSPPSSVKMAFGGGLRRSNSSGNRLVNFADRSQEAHAAVIPQQRGPSSHDNSHLPQEYDTDMTSMHYNDMGPPLSRTLLLQGGSSSRAGSVKSLESNAGSDLVAQVDTDDCGGSLIESITDAHSVHSQDDAPHDSCIQELHDAADEDKKPIANPPSDSSAPSPHPLLCSDGQSLNGRTSPGGTIYKGRGVRRYQGRYMHLPLKRFHQNGVHLNNVDEQGHSAGQPMFDHYSSAHHDDGDPPLPPHWEGNNRYDSGGDTWERDSGDGERMLRDRDNPRLGGGGRRNCGYARKRTRSRSRSRSRSPNSCGNDEKQSSSRYASDRDNRKNRARRSNNSSNYHSSSTGYSSGYHGYDESTSSSSRHRGYRSRGGRGSRNGSSSTKESPSTRNGSNRSKYRRR